jgi:hypothetical protein
MLTSSWPEALAKGIYLLSAEIIQWSGETVNSETIKLNIN